jgi:trehalose 6-phosphate phosphatase
MKHILSHANLPVLEQFACSRTLVAFDYDGTLAPIVAEPARAVMRASTRRALEGLSARYPCAVISGRGRQELSRLLRGVRLAELLGNHGLDPASALAPFAKQVRRWRAALESELAHRRGVVIEDKVYSLAVHYRGSREKRKALAAIRAAIGRLEHTRIISGKMVVDVLPDGAPHKGLALVRTRARLECDTAIFIGDDTTDEDVFALDQPGQLLCVRVGRTRASRAAYYIRDQREIDVLMRRLISLRERGSTRRAL